MILKVLSITVYSNNQKHINYDRTTRALLSMGKELNENQEVHLERARSNMIVSCEANFL